MHGPTWVEPVFGAFEMGRMHGRLPGFDTKKDVDELVTSLRQVIAETLERSIALRCQNTRAYALNSTRPSLTYSGAVVCSVITFNYDIPTEYALHDTRVGYDYKLPGDSSEGITRPNKPFEESTGQIPVLKLHALLIGCPVFIVKRFTLCISVIP